MRPTGLKSLLVRMEGRDAEDVLQQLSLHLHDNYELDVSKVTSHGDVHFEDILTICELQRNGNRWVVSSVDVVSVLFHFRNPSFLEALRTNIGFLSRQVSERSPRHCR
jgi:hypothetical protein